MKHLRMIASLLTVASLIALLLTFQNCGPAKLTMDNITDNSSVGSSENQTSTPIGSKVDLTSLLQAPQEDETNIVFPALRSENNFDYAVGAPTLENIVLMKNDFTQIQWVYGPTETVVAVGDTFSQKEFTADMEGTYYVIGYRGQNASRLAQFNLVQKTVPTVAVDGTGAVQFSQKLIFSDSITEMILVQADAPAVDIVSLQATLKSDGTVISGKRAFLVTKKTVDSADVEIKITDTTGKILDKVVNLPAKLRPMATTQTQILMLAQPTITAVGGETIILTPQFNAVPMAKDYFVFIHFLEPTGLLRSDLTINYTPVVPTSKWNGLVQFTQYVKIPTNLPAGTYSIRMGLYDIVDRTSLAMGPGVVVDSTLRYTVGTLIKK